VEPVVPPRAKPVVPPVVPPRFPQRATPDERADAVSPLAAPLVAEDLVPCIALAMRANHIFALRKRPHRIEVQLRGGMPVYTLTQSTPLHEISESEISVLLKAAVADAE